MRAALPCLLLCLMAVLKVAAADKLSEADLSAARTLSAAKGTKCHKFYEPADYSQADWSEWMEKMRRKAKLKPEQFDLLSRYFEDARTSGQRVGVKGGRKK